VPEFGQRERKEVHVCVGVTTAGNRRADSNMAGQKDAMGGGVASSLLFFF